MTLLINLKALQGKRDKRGRFVKGEPGPRLEHGQRSELVLRLPELARIQTNLVEAVTADRGGREQLSTVRQALIDEWAGLQILTEAQRHKAVSSTKERTRQRALDRYQSLLDRLMRLSVLVGLERETKPTQSLADVMHGD